MALGMLAAGCTSSSPGSAASSLSHRRPESSSAPVSPSAPSGTASQRDASIRATIDQVAADAVPAGVGLSVGVAMDGQIVVRNYGQADARPRLPVTATTIFPIASVTKQFTAAAIMQLVERHKLRLSDQLATLLPSVRWADPRADSVTVRQLLTHTSGIPGYTSVPGFGRLQSRPQSPATILKPVTRLPLKFAPGTQAAYSNTGYYLLGLIIERVTGVRYDDDVRQQLLLPLGMSDTAACPQVAGGRQARLYTTGGRFPNAAPPISLANAYAAGDLCSTAADLLRWQQALSSGRVVTPASYREMVTPLRLLDGHRIAYGFGLDLDPIDGYAAVSHEGGFPGATSDLTWYPHNGLAIAVLSNSSAIAAWTVSAQIAARLL